VEAALLARALRLSAEEASVLADLEQRMGYRGAEI
jgi:hypothetical protein